MHLNLAAESAYVARVNKTCFVYTPQLKLRSKFDAPQLAARNLIDRNAFCDMNEYTENIATWMQANFYYMNEYRETIATWINTGKSLRRE